MFWTIVLGLIILIAAFYVASVLINVFLMAIVLIFTGIGMFFSYLYKRITGKE